MIFPLPYSSYINSHGEPVLSEHSILALDATFEYIQQLSYSVIPARGPESSFITYPKIVLIAEQTFGSKTHKTANLMQKFLAEQKVNIQNIKTVEKIANNTYEQLEALQQIVGNEAVTLIAFAFHVPRIKIIANYLKPNVQILTVEELLKYKLELINKIDNINSSPKMQKVLNTEKTFTKLANIDKLGLIPKTFSYFFGPRTPLI